MLFVDWIIQSLSQILTKARSHSQMVKHEYLVLQNYSSKTIAVLESVELAAIETGFDLKEVARPFD